MRKFVSMLACMAMCFCASNANADMFELSGDIDTAQATTNPDDTGNGFGEIFGTYDDVTNQLDYTITWQDLTSDVNNMHFHVGAVGVAGGVELGIAGPWSSPQTGSATLSEARETNLLAGNWYLNIHTENFGGGEIRGQVVTTAVPEPSSASILILASVGFCLRRRRN